VGDAQTDRTFLVITEWVPISYGIGGLTATRRGGSMDILDK